MKAPALLSLALLSAVLVTPANANWFSDPNLNINRNVGSAPSPTPQDIRENRTPGYPLQARLQNEQGTVGLAISLNQLGNVSGAVVNRSSGFSSLDEAAIQYVKENWAYKPANDGRPMPSVVAVQVTFRLE
jgi:protein TonB